MFNRVARRADVARDRYGSYATTESNRTLHIKPLIMSVLNLTINLKSMIIVVCLVDYLLLGILLLLFLLQKHLKKITKNIYLLVFIIYLKLDNSIKN